MKQKSFLKWRLSALVLFTFLLTTTVTFASTGSGAIQDAANTISGYVTSIKALIYAIGAVVGIIGGVRIYNKWVNGDQDINKEIVGWGGAAVFLIMVPTFIDAFFS